MSLPVKILVAEPSAIVRGGLASILKKALHAEVYEAADAEELKSGLAWHRPAILVVNPLLSGGFSLRRLRRESSEANIKCVALVCALLDPAVTREYDEVVSIYDAPARIGDKITALAGEGPDEQKREALSAREKEVVVCVIQGMTNKQIADKLCLSTHTVITHRRNISAKLQIHSTAGLTIYAIVNKLVDLDQVG